MKDARWRRLERYARWKQGLLPLDALPDDLLDCVASYLDDEAIQALEAVVPWSEPVRLRAVLARAVRALETSIWQHCMEALCDERPSWWGHPERANHNHLWAFVDWSPFAPHPPAPVATSQWTPLPRVVVHTDRLRRCLERGRTEGRPAGQLSLYHTFRWGSTRVIALRPVRLRLVHFQRERDDDTRSATPNGRRG